MNEHEIIRWLREENPDRLAELFRQADAVRRERVGDAVHLRGLVELSNICRRNCLYCGVRAGHDTIERYRLTADEVTHAARLVAEFGYGTLVLQAGEDYGLEGEFVADLIRRVKKEYGLAITLSLGERTETDWRLWREAGADRYLIRFETCNRALFEAIHPPVGKNDLGFEGRIGALRVLRSLGYEIGSGVMIGIPGQTYADLARDLLTFRELDLDMIGNGPYLPHPETPLGRAAEILAKNPETSPAALHPLLAEVGFDYPISDDCVPADNLTAFKVIALTRLLLPDANIPSTTAIATNDKHLGRVTGLQSGANVVMPNLTPTRYRALYEIYPHKSATTESPEETHRTAIAQIRSIGRYPGTGPGGRTHH
ncbi:MAG: [Thermoguttaceae bacterium]|nr:[FeFe] hydrogenase H-cluster radical SAM maturase HydE [Thermoguttaceae bacterium]